MRTVMEHDKGEKKERMREVRPKPLGNENPA